MMYIDEDTVERCLSAGDCEMAQVYATMLQMRAMDRLSRQLERNYVLGCAQ